MLMDSLKLYHGTLRRFKIRDRASGKFLGVIKFSQRGRYFINEEALMKALNQLKRMQYQFNWNDLEIVQYRLIEEKKAPFKEYFVEKLI